MRPLRHLEIGPSGKALVEVTVRTVHSRFLLLPSTWVNATVLGIFARAQARYGVDLSGFAVLSNHLHLLLCVESVRQLAGFMRFVNSNLARKVGKHYGWRQKFFGRRYRAIQVSDEEPAQVDRLRYLLTQGVKEHLVRSPLDWPGVHCAWPLANGKWQLDGWWDDQTAAYRARLRGEKTKRNEFRETETVTLSPLPCWQHRSREAIRNEVRALVEDLEAEAKASGRPVLGVRKILQQNPHAMPAQTKNEPAPHFHAASRRERLRLRNAYELFLAAYRRAARRLRDGDLTVTFPPDCFPPRFPLPEPQPPPA